MMTGKNIIIEIGNSSSLIAMSSRNLIFILHQVWGSKSTKIYILRNCFKNKSEINRIPSLNLKYISVQFLNVLSLPPSKN